MRPDRREDLLEVGTWSICVLAAVVAVYVLRATGVTIDSSSLMLPLLLLTFLFGAHIVYRRWRPEPVIDHVCGALAAVVVSAALGGVVSLAGLRLGAPLIDGALAGFDARWLLDTRAIVSDIAKAPAVASLLGFAYDSSFPLLFALIVFLAWTRRIKPLWQLAFVFAFTVMGCATVSVFFPAMGAFAHFSYPPELRDALPSGAGVYHLPKFEYYRNGLAPVISLSSLQGVITFPSFHCCVALMTTFACLGIRFLFGAALVWNGLVIVSTIPIGGHYVVDLPAGIALWVAATALAGAFRRRPQTQAAPLRAEPVSG